MTTSSLKFTEDEIDDFRDIVSESAKKRSDQLIPTPTPQHAAIVYKHLIEEVQNDIFIYDKDLSGDLLSLEEGSIELLKSKIKGDIKIVFVLDNRDDIIYELIPLFEKSQNVLFGDATEDFRKNVKNILGEDYYFAVADKSMFRLELQQDGSRSAICSFNNEVYSKRLLEAFNSIKLYTFNSLRQMA